MDRRFSTLTMLATILVVTRQHATGTYHSSDVREVLEGRRLQPLADVSATCAILNMTYNPPTTLTLTYDGDAKNVTITINHNCSDKLVVSFRLAGDDRVAVFEYPENGTALLPSNGTELNVSLAGVRMGRARLVVTASTDGSPSTLPFVDGVVTDGYELKVLRPGFSTMTIVGLLMIMVGMATNVFAFGCGLTIDDIRFNFRHPAAVLCSVANQFVIMPVLTFVIGLCFGLSGVSRYVLLSIGCSSGGPPSNLCTLLLRGDVNLSVTMTFTATICTILALPLWMWTLGTYLLRIDYPGRAPVAVPWLVIFVLILIFAVPTLLGVLVCWCSRRAGRILSALLRIVALTTACTGLGIYLNDNVWMFKHMDDWKMIVAPALVSNIGYLIGFPLGYFVARQTLHRSLAVMIETGVRNGPFGLFYVLLTVPRPEADLSGSMVLIFVFLALLPLLAAVLVGACRRIALRLMGREGDKIPINETVEGDWYVDVKRRSVVAMDDHTISRSVSVVSLTTNDGKKMSVVSIDSDAVRRLSQAHRSDMRKSSSASLFGRKKSTASLRGSEDSVDVWHRGALGDIDEQRESVVSQKRYGRKMFEESLPQQQPQRRSAIVADTPQGGVQREYIVTISENVEGKESSSSAAGSQCHCPPPTYDESEKY